MLANQAAEGTVALNADLKRFAEHGGKLILYHGWADQQVAPGATVEFYNSVVALSGSPGQSSAVGAVVHGTRHGALRGRRGTECLRQDQRPGALG